MSIPRGGGGTNLKSKVVLADGGTWFVMPPDLWSPDKTKLTSQDTTSDEGIKETSTEGDRRSREEFVVDLVTEFMPGVECILLEGQLDKIKERSAEIGAINARLDVIETHINKMNITLDNAFEKFDAIKSRF